MDLYFDTQGRPLTLMQWAHLFEERGSDPDERWWRVGHTVLRAAEVSTVWLGLDQGIGPHSKPLIFESMVFAEDIEETRRYSTWEEAERGHAELVRAWTKVRPLHPPKDVRRREAK